MKNFIRDFVDFVKIICWVIKEFIKADFLGAVYIGMACGFCQNFYCNMTADGLDEVAQCKKYLHSKLDPMTKIMFGKDY